MPRVSFTRNLSRHVPCEARDVAGTTVREALEAYFALNPAPRPYVLDEHAAVRRHVVIFVGGVQVEDRVRLSDTVGTGDEITVMQALSGG
ncbi:MAG TPA: MoaD/ThiS family protein [Acidimicrobiales bacterium]|nr:MoaD/ThiS family protein [Acidimicrobiales bacterium]